MAQFNANFNKLFKRLDNMNQSADKVKKKLINQSANLVLKQMQTDAPKDSGNSANKLSIVEARNGEGYLFLDVGINSKNWEETKGLYFQHYGFKSKGATLWMTVSYKKASKRASKIIKDGLKKELGL